MLEQLSIENVTALKSHREDVWPDEIHSLYETFGPAEFYFSRLKMGVDYFSRWHYVRYEKKDRRAEVVFAIQNDRGELLLHTKPAYPNNVFRLPSGGIGINEPVKEALFREMFEETGLKPVNVHLLSVLLYIFEHNHITIPFSSYVFLVTSNNQQPKVQDPTEDIAGFKWIPPQQLGSVIEELHSLPDKRWQDWGEMRALAHQVIEKSDHNLREIMNNRHSF